MRKDRGPREPVEPIATTIGVLLVLMASYLLLNVLTRNSPFAGQVCATASGAMVMSGRRPPVLGVVGGLARGSHVDLSSALLCVGHPGAALRLAGLLVVLPSVLVLAIFLLRLRALLLVAGLPGVLYSPATAARLRWLGWFLIAGSLAAGILESVAETAIFLAAVSRSGYDWFEPQDWHLPVVYLVLGIALISVAGVMRAAASRRDEDRVTV